MLTISTSTPIDSAPNKPLDTALEHAACGWPVFPCWWVEDGRCACPDGAACSNKPGKHPIGSCAPRGFHNATTDPELISAWWARWPHANVAIATGAVSDLVVVDLDQKPAANGKPAVNGVESLKGLCKVPPSRVVRTGSGGQHLYFQHPGVDTPSSTGKLGPGIDVRADGGYVLAPGSSHHTGQSYTLVEDRPLAELPARLLARMLGPAKNTDATGAPAPVTLPPATPAEIESARSALAKAGPAIDGEGGCHNKAMAAALLLWNDFALTDEEAWPLFEEWNDSCRPPWSPKELEHKHTDALKKIDARTTDVAYGSRRASPPPVTLKSLQLTFTAAKLKEQPPSRVYDLTDDATGKGLLPRGKVGILGAPGGVGKTTALIQLAVAGATGGVLFGAGGWNVAQGKTLLILCEEDAEEIQRRIHYTLRDLDDDVIDAVAQSIIAFPLAGYPTDLIGSADGNTFVETPKAAELRQLIEEFKPARILADPLSRLTIKENDNTAMRRVVQVLETFTAPQYGSPTVLVAAHTRKESKDADPDSVDGIRGGKSLTDSARFVALLEQMKRIEGAPDLLKLKVSKNNYGARYDGVMLCRPEDGHGALRVATAEENHVYSSLKSRKGAASDPDEVSRLILADLEANGPGSGTDLAGRIGKNKSKVLAACNDLASTGQIEKIEGLWQPVPTGSKRFPEPG